MKLSLAFISFSMVLCFLGCSKDNKSAQKTWGRSLVPPTAADVVAAPDYKLEYTTKSGVQCYVHAITPELAGSLTIDSPEFRYLFGTDKHYFVIPVRDGKIVELNPTDAAEVKEFLAQRPKK